MDASWMLLGCFLAASSMPLGALLGCFLERFLERFLAVASCYRWFGKTLLQPANDCPRQAMRACDYNLLIVKIPMNLLKHLVVTFYWYIPLHLVFRAITAPNNFNAKNISRAILKGPIPHVLSFLVPNALLHLLDMHTDS